MFNLRDMPIRRKLRLIIMLTSCAVLLLACGHFVAYDLFTFRRDLSDHLSGVAEITGVNSAAALLFGDATAAEQNLSAFRVEPRIVGVCIFTPDRKPFATYVRAGERGWTPPKPVSDGVLFERGHLVLHQPIIHKGERVGTICLEHDCSEIRDRLRRYAIIVALVLLVSLLVALLLSARLQRLVSDPILHLVETAQAVSARHDYALRANPQGDDELGLLIDSFNQMLAQIQSRDESLLRSNRELQDFAYVASHDLQEPLRKIQAFGDRLKAKCADALSADGRDYLERMQNAANRMQTLINDLLAFSRVTTKAQPFTEVDLETVAREVLSDLEVRLEQTGGRVELGELPRLEADPLQMRQLLQNLVGNALKFHRQDVPPVIQVSARRLEGAVPSPAGNGAHCELIVADNGIGFDMKYLDRIFGVFQRLHGRDEYEGTGVGLAICRKIAERHGGRITAQSKPGEGATFVVTLPVHQPHSEGAKS